MIPVIHTTHSDTYNNTSARRRDEAVITQLVEDIVSRQLICQHVTLYTHHHTI